MRSILSMFSKSPFKPLGSHMDKVRACVDQIEPLFKALSKEDYDEVDKISELMSATRKVLSSSINGYLLYCVPYMVLFVVI